MVSQEYAIYAEEVFRPSIDEEKTQYVLENLWKGRVHLKNSVDELADLLFDELTENGKKVLSETAFTEVAHNYLPPIRAGNGVMIVPRHLNTQELRFFAREYAQKFKKCV